MKLIIVRHAETKQNVRDVYQGHTPGELTVKGRLQARRLGLRLRRRRFYAIFSSDLKRVKDTTREIARYHDMPVHYTKLLRERNIGIYEGRARREVLRIIADSGVDRFYFKPRGGESLEELNLRIARFLKKIKKGYRNKTLLVVTHGGAVRAFMQLCLDIPFEKAIRFKPTNASVIIIDVGKKRIIRGS